MVNFLNQDFFIFRHFERFRLRQVFQNFKNTFIPNLHHSNSIAPQPRHHRLLRFQRMVRRCSRLFEKLFVPLQIYSSECFFSNFFQIPSNLFGEEPFVSFPLDARG